MHAAWSGTNSSPRTLSYNPAENAVLLTGDADGGSYDLYSIPKDANGSAVVRFPSLPSSSSCPLRSPADMLIVPQCAHSQVLYILREMGTA